MPRLYASVTPRTHARVTALAHSEEVSVSAMCAVLIREALEARAVAKERIRREFEFPPGMFLGVSALDRRPS